MARFATSTPTTLPAPRSLATTTPSGPSSAEVVPAECPPFAGSLREKPAIATCSRVAGSTSTRFPVFPAGTRMRRSFGANPRSSNPIPDSPPGICTAAAAARSTTQPMSIARRLALLAALVAPAAVAYRPFDNTDADVSKQGEIELELGPLGFVSTGGQTEYAPMAIFNYGFARRTEVVVEAATHLPVGAGVGPSFSVSEVQVSIKRVLREGVLQEESGPSVAAECGVLLPGYREEHGFGVLCTGIVSVRNQIGAVHFN